MTPTPRILILSAPSGGGKTSLARALLAQCDDVGLTVSHTTRTQRCGEVDGVDYHFVARPDFMHMIATAKFVEYATVFDHYYGTSINAVEQLAAAGRHAILDIDWQGARNVRKKYPGVFSVFVMPPSIADLEQRLRRRRQDSEAVIARRMQVAADEMSHRDEFDAVIVNDHFDHALAQLMGLVEQLRADGGDDQRAGRRDATTAVQPS